MYFDHGVPFFLRVLSHISVWLSCASTECLNDAGGGADL